MMTRQPSGTSQATVTLAELATAIDVGPDVMGVIERAGVKLETDWAGRPAVPMEMAARIVSDQRQLQEAGRRKQLAYDAYLRERVVARKTAGDEAFHEAERAQAHIEYRDRAAGNVMTSSVLPVSPAGLSAARDAHSEALAAFDRKHPVTPLERFKE